MGFTAEGSGYVFSVDEELLDRLCATFDTDPDELANDIQIGDFENSDNIDSIIVGDQFDTWNIGWDLGVWYVYAEDGDGETEAELSEILPDYELGEYFHPHFEIELFQ